MKVNFPALFQAPIQKYTHFFIYGNEPSVFERSIAYIKHQLSLPVQLKTEEDLLKQQPEEPSLFSEGPTTFLILVHNVTDKILKQIDSLKSGHYIFTSEKARAKSKLVTHFSDSRLSLAIPAYASPITTSEFDYIATGTNLPVSFKGKLLKAYQNDYMGLLGAIQKIRLYGEVADGQFEDFLSNASFSDDFSSLSHSILSKNSRQTIQYFNNINEAEMIPLLRTLSRTFQILFELIPYQRNVSTIPWFKLTPPVFFKDQPFYETALKVWKIQEIKSLLELLLNLERRIKRGTLTSPQFQHEILAFCQIERSHSIFE